MAERLQKLMAQAGLGSRRSCEELIATGRVTVNGKRADLGQKADPSVDSIMVDGILLKPPEVHQYIAIYKPRNVLTTVEAPDPRPTVRDLVPLPGTLYPVGRLDVDSEGLVLLTNDGNLANHLTHPRYEHEKEYKVLVSRRPDDAQLETWRRGVVLEDGHKTLPARVTLISPFGQGAWLKVVLREGRKRQIREVGSLIGLPVVRIIRLRISSLRLGRLKPGEWRSLTESEINDLKGTLKTRTHLQHVHHARSQPIMRPPGPRNKNKSSDIGQGINKRPSANNRTQPRLRKDLNRERVSRKKSTPPSLKSN